MKSLEEEAWEKWLEKLKVGYDLLSFSQGYISGANSKRVQVEKIKAQIEIIDKIAKSELSKKDITNVFMNGLEQQLKKLEDGTQNN